jgi:hypothetical protein
MLSSCPKRAHFTGSDWQHTFIMTQRVEHARHDCGSQPVGIPVNCAEYRHGKQIYRYKLIALSSDIQAAVEDRQGQTKSCRCHLP